MPQVDSEQNSIPTVKFSRRKFLGIASATAAISTAGLLVNNRNSGATETEEATAGKVKYGMVIDLDSCMGCRACMEACKVENNTPTSIFWMYVFRLEAGKYPAVNYSFLPRPCMHCEKPPCVQVCPVSATYKDDSGRVSQDSERCIGCRFCIQACPYGVRYFNDKDPKKNYYLPWNPPIPELESVTKGAIPPYRNPDLYRLYPVGVAGFEGKEAPLAGGGKAKGVVEKCTFCLHRVEKGLLPACVANCPVNALHFGDLNNPESEVSKLLTQNVAHVLLEGMGTSPKVFYIGHAPILDTGNIPPSSGLCNNSSVIKS